MKHFYRPRFLAVALMLVVAISGGVIASIHIHNQIIAAAGQTTTYTYQGSSDNITNPERGFFNTRVVYYTSNWSGAGGLATSDLSSIRQNGNSVVLVYYILQNFASTQSPQQSCSQPYTADEPLPSDFMNGLNNDLGKIRSADLKVIMRFAYNFSGGTPDAPLCRVLGHIDQLAPVIQNNVDVIDLLEAGFVGAWGEWHDSSNQLVSPDANGVDQINTASRLIINELLNILPSQRMLALRYPRHAMDLFSSTPLTAAQAYSGVGQARIAAHNDCFLLRADEGGTFQSDGNNTPQAQQTYWQQDNQYVAQVGETCGTDSPNTDCPNALTELAQYHWSALNEDYDKDVLNTWGSCMSEIQQKLGYRFRLVQSTLPNQATTGQSMNISFTIANDGWADLYNPRNVDLVLQNQQNASQQYSIQLNQDPRRWWSGQTTTVSISVQLPSNIPAGTYNLYLNLPDPASTLINNPAYAIQLANVGLWNAQTGFNSLQASMQVAASTGTTTPTPTPTTGPNPSPSPTPTITSVPTGTPTPVPSTATATATSGNAACKVTYMVSSQWTGGFSGAITIANTGSTSINGWTLQFAFPAIGQSVTQGWSANWSQSGQNVTATDVGWNGSLAPGSSTGIGFAGAFTTNNPVPTSFTLNGVTCTNG
jgi:Domain of unknown function (DUF4832)/Domain of unknown function (DUF4874)/Cellulose binding domain